MKTFMISSLRTAFYWLDRFVKTNHGFQGRDGLVIIALAVTAMVLWQQSTPQVLGEMFFVILVLGVILHQTSCFIVSKAACFMMKTLFSVAKNLAQSQVIYHYISGDENTGVRNAWTGFLMAARLHDPVISSPSPSL